MPRTDVVITGAGIVSSIGIGVDEFFQGLLDKRSGIGSLSRRTDGGPVPGAVTDPPGMWIGGPVVEFDPKQHIRPRKALKVMCREIQTAFAASMMSIKEAGSDDALPAQADGPIKPADVGVVFGSEMFYGPPDELRDGVVACFREDGAIDQSIYGQMAIKHVMPLWMLKYLPNMPACHVGIALGGHGPNNSVLAGDVSGSAALIEAASYIDRGIAKMVITGGTGTLINVTRMSYRNDLPLPDVYDPIELSSRPHDPQAVGVVGGEGAAAMAVEHESHARQRGAQPMARLVSYASRFVPCDQMYRPDRTAAIDRPGVRGSQRAIQLAIETALRDAGISADQLGLVVTHGMGDPIMDGVEFEALRQTVSPSTPAVATIASLGHTGAACSAIDLVTAAVALSRRTVPPTLQTESTRKEVGFLAEAKPLENDFALVVSHTTDGNATAIVLAAV